MSGESSREQEGLAKYLGLSISEDAGKGVKKKFNNQNNKIIGKKR